VFKDSDVHLKAPANNSGHYMNELMGKCVGLISGRAWRSVRSVTEPPFSHWNASQATGMIERHVSEYFQQLHDSGTLGSGLLHPAEDMKMLPFWVVAEVFYGRLTPVLQQELASLAPVRERIFRYAIRGGLPRFSWSRWLPSTANSELHEFKRRWKHFNRQAVNSARAQTGDTKAPIVAMSDAVLAETLSEEQLLQTLDESLYTNLDVTTGGLSWNLVFLAERSDVQTRLRNEVEEARRAGTLRAYVLSRETYLAACVLESSRLKPLAAFSVPQAAPTTRDVDGFVIPAGTSFVVDAYALNIRNARWAPDNTTYRPDRFLDQREGDRRYSFWRFGFGPRQCMGKYVADLVIRQALVHLVLHYDLALVDDSEWKRSKVSWITHPDFQIRCTAR
jgi:cytochrome P450